MPDKPEDENSVKAGLWLVSGVPEGDAGWLAAAFRKLSSEC